MKNYIATFAVAVTLMMVVFGMDCVAQSPARLVATIPFEFNVGNETLPAGQYEFRNLSRQAYPGSFAIRSTDRMDERSFIVPAMANDGNIASDAVGVVFNRYGSTYFLSRIDLRGSDLAVRFGKTSAERQLEKRREQRVAVLIPPTAPARH